MDKKFTDLTKSQVAKLYETRSTAAIAAMFAVSPETVRKRMVSLGIKRRAIGMQRQFSPPKAVLAKLYRTKSMSQIAEEFGVGETVVWKRLQEHGIKLKGFENGGHRLKPGRKFSESHRANLAKAKVGIFAGEKNPNWQGGITGHNLRLRGSFEYKQWRKGAMALHGNACQSCGVKDNDECGCCGTRIKLHVHHVISFARYPETRFDPKNSEVLCPKCHHSRHRSKLGELSGKPDRESRRQPAAKPHM